VSKGESLINKGGEGKEKTRTQKGARASSTEEGEREKYEARKVEILEKERSACKPDHRGKRGHTTVGRGDEKGERGGGEGPQPSWEGAAFQGEKKGEKTARSKREGLGGIYEERRRRSEGGPETRQKGGRGERGSGMRKLRKGRTREEN